jgi:hypothetical protein
MCTMLNYVASVGYIVRTRKSCFRRRGLSTLPSSSVTMETNDVAMLLLRVKDGTLPIEKAVAQLSQRKLVTSSNSSGHHTSSLSSSFANIDYNRYERTNFPEVIFAQSKTPQQVAMILDEMAGKEIEQRKEKINNNNATSSSVTATSSEQNSYKPPILATRYDFVVIFEIKYFTSCPVC